MRFYIYETGNCFSYRPTEREDDSYKWGECEISISSIGDYNGIIGIVFDDLPIQIYKKFTFESNISGSYAHERGYGKYFELGWEVRDNKSNEKFILKVTGSDYTNSWGAGSVARGLVKFLNDIHQFNSITDYIKYNNICDNRLWEGMTYKDKIVALADAIKIYDTYIKINPAAFTIKDLEKILKKRMESMLKDFE